MKSIEVVAGVIVSGGKVFATQRGYGDFKDYWEFPGGKMEPGESPEEALRREIEEELATEVEVGKRIGTVDYDYPDFHITLHFYRCAIVSGDLELLEHEAAKWLGPGQVPSLDWLPADKEILPEIMRQLGD